MSIYTKGPKFAVPHPKCPNCRISGAVRGTLTHQTEHTAPYFHWRRCVCATCGVYCIGVNFESNESVYASYSPTQRNFFIYTILFSPAEVEAGLFRYTGKVLEPKLKVRLARSEWAHQFKKEAFMDWQQANQHAIINAEWTFDEQVRRFATTYGLYLRMLKEEGK